MRAPSDYDNAMEIARRPALLVDVAEAAAAAARARDAAADDEQRAAAQVRRAALMRRSNPEKALQALDAAGPHGQTAAGRRIRSHVLLDLGRADEARSLPASTGESAADTWLTARLTAVSDRTAALADAAVERATDPEVRAELLVLRARWRAEADDVHGALADADALLDLCEAHDAPLSLLMVELMRLGFDVPGQSATSRLEQALELVVDEAPLDLRTLGPLPEHLHGLMVRYAGRHRDAQAYVLGVRTITELAAAAERSELAFETLVDGAELARRVFGGRVSAPLEARYRTLAEHLGAERIAELHARRRRRTEMLLRRTNH